MQRRDPVPVELRNRPRWVAWAETNETKVPLGSSTDPSTWKSHAEITGPRKGFVLGDGIVGVDLDSCRDPASGEIAPKAMEIIKTLGSYTEVSPSGTGVKIFLAGAKPAGVTRCKWSWGLWQPTPGKKAAVEVYDAARFFTVTGNPVPGFMALRSAGDNLANVVGRLEAERERVQGKVEGKGTPLRSVPDDKLVEMLSKLPVTRRAMDLLFHAADRDAHGGDESKCDFVLLAALCRLSSNEEQVVRVFEQSELYKTKDDKHREKWNREDYRKRSLEAAFRVGEADRLADNGMNYDVLTVLKENKKTKESEPEEIKIPLAIDKVEARVRGFLGDEFAVVNGQPVLVQDRLGTRLAHAVDDAACLFAHIGRKHGMVVKWAAGLGMVSKDELKASLTLGGPHFWRMNEMPHEPPLPDELYCCPKMPEPDMAVLEEYLGFFNFVTPEDRDLFLAYVATPFWGGPGGARPLFVFTSPDGKGVGKSTAMEAAGKLVGTDSMTIPPDVKDLQAVVTRLFGAAGKRKRVLTIDNLTGHIRSDELTSFITSSTISGRENYVGEGTRPNTMTYCMSLNTPDLDNDIAIRSVEIAIARPKRSAAWEPRYLEFLRSEKRLVVVSTLLRLLRDGRGHPGYKDLNLRFPVWADQVLRRCAANPQAALEKACAAQVRLDADEEDIEQFMFELRNLATARARVSCGEKANLATHRVWIQNGVVAEIFRRATQRKWANNTVLRHLHGLVKRGARGIEALVPDKTTLEGESVRGFTIGRMDGANKSDCFVTQL